jgi:hypothetical protein
MNALKPEELNTLEIIANPDCTDSLKRGHLEKLSRLDLIEPCSEGVCMTARGRQVLSGRK